MLRSLYPTWHRRTPTTSEGFRRGFADRGLHRAQPENGPSEVEGGRPDGCSHACRPSRSHWGAGSGEPDPAGCGAGHRRQEPTCFMKKRLSYP
jgi:hypothetical protein